MFQQVADPRTRIAALIDPDPGRRDMLALVLEQHAITLSDSFGSVAKALEADLSPHLLIYRAEGASEDVRADLQKLREATPAALLVVLDRPDPAAIEALLAEGADEVLPLGPQGDRFAVAAAGALGTARYRRRQQGAIDAAEARLAEARAVFRAKSILIARHGLGEEEAHKRLLKLSMDRNVSLATMARTVIEAEQLLC